MIADATLLSWMKADAADTAMLRILEQAAIKAAEKITGRYLGIANATLTETIRFKNWPLVLANEPTGGVITTLSYWDGTAYVLVDAADYYVDGSFIWSNSTYTPPTTEAPLRYKAVYPAGYAGAGDVWAAPMDIQAAILLLVGHWYENREAVIVGTSADEIPLSARALLASHMRVTV